MRVKNWMIKKVVTVSKNDSLQKALVLMRKYSIRHLPVVEGRTLLGLITEGDLRQAITPTLMADVTADQVMIKNPVTVGPEESLEEAARLIYRYKIGGLPVVDKGRLVGILTTPDILAAFIQLMGVLEASSTLEIKLPHRPQAFEQASGIIQQKGGKIISVGMMGKGTKRTHLFRLKRCPLEPIVSALEKKGHKVIAFEA